MHPEGGPPPPGTAPLSSCCPTSSQHHCTFPRWFFPPESFHQPFLELKATVPFLQLLPCPTCPNLGMNSGSVGRIQLTSVCGRFVMFIFFNNALCQSLRLCEFKPGLK